MQFAGGGPPEVACTRSRFWRGCATSVRSPSVCAKPSGPLLAQTAVGDVALVFGNETSGLSNEELQCCQQAVTIPSNPAYSSLNLGAAVQVMAYELRMAAYGGLPPGPATQATPSFRCRRRSMTSSASTYISNGCWTDRLP